VCASLLLFRLAKAVRRTFHAPDKNAEKLIITLHMLGNFWASLIK
jgi:hypothetical protein